MNHIVKVIVKRSMKRKYLFDNRTRRKKSKYIDEIENNIRAIIEKNKLNIKFVSLESTDNEYRTLLMQCCIKNSDELCMELLKKPVMCYLNKKDSNGYSALQIACQCEKVNIALKILIKIISFKKL